MPVQALACKECGTEYELEARYVCERCFGPLEVRYDYGALDADVGQAPRSRPARRTSGATPTSCRSSSAPQYALPAGCTPLVRAPRLAERLGLREVWVKNDTANPTHSFKDRVVAVALAKAQELGYEVVACASTGNLANAVAAHAAAAGLESYVFIPADLEEQKVLATGVYGTKLVAVRGNYDDVNRLCTELSAERDWAFVNVNVRPYYAEGSKTLGLRDRRAARLRAARPRRRAGRVGLAVHQDRTRLRGVARGRAGRGRDCRRSTAPRPTGCSPVAQALRGRLGRLQAGQAATRSPSRWRSATRPTGPTRSSWRGARGGAVDAVTDDEIRAGIRLLAETTGIFTETAGGVTTAMLRKLAERGDIDPDERVVLVITGEGLKTLDAVRGTFETHEIDADRRVVRRALLPRSPSALG